MTLVKILHPITVEVGQKRGYGYSSKNVLEIYEAFDESLQSITQTEGVIKLFK